MFIRRTRRRWLGVVNMCIDMRHDMDIDEQTRDESVHTACHRSNDWRRYSEMLRARRNGHYSDETLIMSIKG